jgi:DNA polymerase III gamma/tau subunit
MTSANWPVIGHAWAVLSLDRAVSDDRPAHAYLISGPPQIGKTTLARSLALASTANRADSARLRPVPIVPTHQRWQASRRAADRT